MREEILVAVVMFLILIGGSIATKNDKKWSVLFLFLASVAGSLAAGMGIRFREIVEGPFGFLDSMLCVCAASVFVAALAQSGVFELLFSKICGIKNLVLKAFAMLLFIALPSALTGFAGSSIMTTGKIFSEAVQDKRKASVIVGVGAFIGVLLPPNCIPAMIAANGAGSVLPTPYTGFYLPLLVLALPAFIAFALIQRKGLSEPAAKGFEKNTSTLISLVVLCLVCLATFMDGVFASVLYLGGNTLVFFVGTIVVLVACKGRKTMAVLSDGIMKAVGPMALVFALGSFIEVSSMTGIRGIYSYWILPHNTTAVMLVLMAASLVIGYFLSVPIPAFLITYAVFPIGWLANTVIVTGCSTAIALVALLTMNGGVFKSVTDGLGDEFKLGRKESLKAFWPVALLVLAMGIIMVVFGDSLSFLIR